MNSDYSGTRFRSDPPPGRVWPDSFAVLTAQNPNGLPAEPALNIARDQALARRLKADHVPHWRVSGGDPAYEGTEDGYAVVMPFAAAVALGRDFGQEAIFWVEKDALMLVACADGAREPIGSWTERQDASPAKALRAAVPSPNAQAFPRLYRD